MKIAAFTVEPVHPHETKPSSICRMEFALTPEESSRLLLLLGGRSRTGGSLDATDVRNILSELTSFLKPEG